MILTSLRTNQLSPAAWVFYRDYLAALDDYDVERFAGFLADDVEVQFNNDPPLAGKATAVAALAEFWGSVTAMGFSLLHEPLNIYGTDDRYVPEALNHYDASDGARITVRAVAFTDRDAAGAVSSIRL